MTLTLSLPPATIERLRKHSEKTGRDVNDCISLAVESYLNATAMSFDEILAPLRKQVNESGMSEAQVDSLLEDAVAESRASRKQPQK